MTKQTKEHKARALKRIQLMINDWFISPAALSESPDVKNAIYNELLKLEKREYALLNPQPKQPRKPKAVPAVQEAERGVTVVELPEGLRNTGNAIGKRVRK